jgi:hypothetical protein
MSAGRSDVLVTVKLRLDWHDRMTFDLSLKPIDVRVGAAIGWHINKHTGLTFVGRETIAAKLGVDVKTVGRSIKRLLGRRHLSVVRGRGRGHSNHYSIALRPTSQRLDGTEENGTLMSPLAEVETGTTVSPIRNAEKGTFASWKGDIPVQKRGHQCPSNPVVSNPEEINTNARASADDDLFEDFRRYYPFERWMSLKAAQAAFKKLSINEQVDACRGASRYATDCVQQRRKVQNVKNWIAERCWEGYIAERCSAFDANSPLLANPQQPGTLMGTVRRMIEQGVEFAPSPALYGGSPSNGLLEARESILVDGESRRSTRASMHMLAAYSPEWEVFRSERIAAGEDVTFMEDRAKQGLHWDARARRPGPPGRSLSVAGRRDR